MLKDYDAVKRNAEDQNTSTFYRFIRRLFIVSMRIKLQCVTLEIKGLSSLPGSQSVFVC